MILTATLTASIVARFGFDPDRPDVEALALAMSRRPERPLSWYRQQYPFSDVAAAWAKARATTQGPALHWTAFTFQTDRVVDPMAGYRCVRG